MPGLVFAAWALTIAGVVAAQSVVHLLVVFHTDRIGTFIDLDRSNGLPDLVSTAFLAIAAVGAVVLSQRETDLRRLAAAFAAGALAALTVADLLHDGAHPSGSTGPLVIALVAFTVALVAIIGAGGSARVRVTLAFAACFLAASFLITGLDRLDQRFERERGDPTREYQIVAKEGLELLGWSLVALALWDEALRRRVRRRPATAPASRARAASRRRVA
jgi:hypothetical protein